MLQNTLDSMKFELENEEKIKYNSSLYFDSIKNVSKSKQLMNKELLDLNKKLKNENQITKNRLDSAHLIIKIKEKELKEHQNELTKAIKYMNQGSSESEEELECFPLNDVVVEVPFDTTESASWSRPAVDVEVAEAVDTEVTEASKIDEQAFKAEMKKLYPTATFTASGLAYIIEKQGSGQLAKAGNTVIVHYYGAFTNGRKFDASYDRNKPLSFQLGQGMVISGWEEGIALLNKGAKAKFIIPYWLAYGVDGRAPLIPVKSTLIFDTEIVDIK